MTFSLAEDHDGEKPSCAFAEPQWPVPNSANLVAIESLVSTQGTPRPHPASGPTGQGPSASPQCHDRRALQRRVMDDRRHDPEIGE
jgi:hypothetical protein